MTKTKRAGEDRHGCLHPLVAVVEQDETEIDAWWYDESPPRVVVAPTALPIRGTIVVRLYRRRRTKR